MLFLCANATLNDGLISFVPQCAPSENIGTTKTALYTYTHMLLS